MFIEVSFSGFERDKANFGLKRREKPNNFSTLRPSTPLYHDERRIIGLIDEALPALGLRRISRAVSLAWRALRFQQN